MNITNTTSELYVQLGREYTVCPVHPVQAKTAGDKPLDFEPQIPHPFPGATPDEMPEVPPDDCEEDDDDEN